MRLECPECRQTLQVPDGQEGRQARCPKCGNIFHIGTANAGPEPAWSPPARDPVPVAPSQEAWMLQIADGRVYGPIDRPTLDAWAAEGRVGRDSRVKRAGESVWQSAETLYQRLPQGVHPRDDSGAAFAGGGAYTAAAAKAPVSGLEAHRGGAVLALGIIGFFCVITGIIAIVMGANDLKKIKDGQMDPNGHGLTQAGYVLGIISVVFAAIKMFAGIASINLDL